MICAHKNMLSMHKKNSEKRSFLKLTKSMKSDGNRVDYNRFLGIRLKRSS